MKKAQAGFSLIELLIVVAIILVIAAIAIPNFLAARMSANESSSVQELRSITTAQLAYQTQYGIGYAVALADLGGTGSVSSSSNALLIDPALASGAKNGYLFVYVPLLQDAGGNYITYSLNANPKIVGATGRRYFYTDQVAILHYSYAAAATATDPPIQ
jgi:prepilin-type N-terminal cleavage/methylation domain-containing protein